MVSCGRISTHSPREGRSTGRSRTKRTKFYFNSLAPRGAIRYKTATRLERWHFNSLAPRGAIREDERAAAMFWRFQLTRPARGDPIFVCVTPHKIYHFNSLAPRGASPHAVFCNMFDQIISTHSPREGRSFYVCVYQFHIVHFNSLAPRGAILLQAEYISLVLVFQLTRPARGDPIKGVCYAYRIFISTHSPREGRSILAEKTEKNKVISTHSPREGRSLSASVDGLLSPNFNSLAPRGAILLQAEYISLVLVFQLTRPARGDPKQLTKKGYRNLISTHSPREGRSDKGGVLCLPDFHFNSLAPRGAIHTSRKNRKKQSNFNSLAPRGAIPLRKRGRVAVPEFQLTRPARGDPK